MPSHEFQRICRDLSNFGESITISCTKDGVQFTGSGDIGSAKVTLRQNATVDKEDDQVSLRYRMGYFSLNYLVSPVCIAYQLRNWSCQANCSCRTIMASCRRSFVIKYSAVKVVTRQFSHALPVQRTVLDFLDRAIHTIALGKVCCGH